MNQNLISSNTGAALLPPPLLLPLAPALSATIEIRETADIVRARESSRQLTSNFHASEVDTTLITTIISELARNILIHAQTGEIRIDGSTADSGRAGITITARDHGPGIADIQRALIGGYSTCGRMGLGISGVRRMADEFHIESTSDRGTTIIARKWLA